MKQVQLLPSRWDSLLRQVRKAFLEVSESLLHSLKKQYFACCMNSRSSSMQTGPRQAAAWAPGGGEGLPSRVRGCRAPPLQPHSCLAEDREPSTQGKLFGVSCREDELKWQSQGQGSPPLSLRATGASAHRMCLVKDGLRPTAHRPLTLKDGKRILVFLFSTHHTYHQVTVPAARP